MALPIIPIIAVALIAMFAGGKKKSKTVTPFPEPDPQDEGELYAFTLGDFMAGEPLEVDVLPGDMIRFDFEVSGPASWVMYSEVVAGQPVLVVEEDFVAPDVGGVEGAPGRYIADVGVHPGVGAVQMDFVRTETGADNPTVLRAEKVIVNVV